MLLNTTWYTDFKPKCVSGNVLFDFLLWIVTDDLKSCFMWSEREECSLRGTLSPYGSSSPSTYPQGQVHWTGTYAHFRKWVQEARWTKRRKNGYRGRHRRGQGWWCALYPAQHPRSDLSTWKGDRHRSKLTHCNGWGLFSKASRWTKCPLTQ